MTATAFDTFMRIFEAFRGNPAPAYYHIHGDLSYAELHTCASALGRLLAAHDGTSRAPVMIYGHKDRRYPIAYWACILAGRPLIPIEPELPVHWIQRIREQSGASIMLDATSTGSLPPCTGVRTISVPTSAHPALDPPWQSRPHIDANDTMYILFSSGTSGRPKGIRVSYGNVADFLTWLETLFHEFGTIQAITSNVRFCFDVSLFELWTAWLLTKPLSALDHAEFFNSRKYIDRFGEHRVTTWVSTPTMMRHYLADRCFRASELPTLNTFLFCGEVLPKRIVCELWNRFDGCRVFNTYGPTECTVAVTSVRILPAHVSSGLELPIGYARQGTRLELDRRQAHEECGEIIIRGAAVGSGYLNLPDRQAHSFPAPDTYRTGDLGRVEADGLWYFVGRIDREVKVQGVRIDLNDIEACIRQLPDIIDVVVDVYRVKGEAHALSAFVVGPAHASQLCSLANEMARDLPPHLIPRFWYGVHDPELNQNGKLDRSDLVKSTKRIMVQYVHRNGPNNC